MEKVTVIYHSEAEGWWAESPKYPNYAAAGNSLSEVQLLVREGLPWYLGKPVEICDGLGAVAAVATTSLSVEETPVKPAFVGSPWRRLTPSTMPSTS